MSNKNSINNKVNSEEMFITITTANITNKAFLGTADENMEKIMEIATEHSISKDEISFATETIELTDDLYLCRLYEHTDYETTNLRHMLYVDEDGLEKIVKLVRNSHENSCEGMSNVIELIESVKSYTGPEYSEIESDW